MLELIVHGLNLVDSLDSRTSSLHLIELITTTQDFPFCQNAIYKLSGDEAGVIPIESRSLSLYGNDIICCKLEKREV